MYEYDAVVERVVDGDTVRLRVDLGFDTWHTGTFRLLGIAARELAQPGGREARDHLTLLLPAGTAVTVQSAKPDKYGGRYLARVWLDELDVCEELVVSGWAARWDGRGPQPAPAWPRQIAEATP